MPVTRADTKPYDFVPLNHDGTRPAAIRGHERWRNLTGALTCTLTALTPLHVGSGQVVPVSELRSCGDVNWPAELKEALIVSHFRTTNHRVIPASSLKGSIRCIVEAISRSCICVAARKKVNKETSRHTPFKSSSFSCFVKRGQRSDQVKLCPACSLFGAMGFEGKVRFSDAPQSNRDGQIVFRPAPNQPNKTNDGRHSTHRDKYYHRTDDGNWYVKGRKFYHHFRAPENQSVKYEPVEVCGSGSTFTFHLDFESLLEAELGLLLVALGQGDGITIFKLGGSKPFGYGAVKVSRCEGEVWDERRSRRRCLEWDQQPIAALDWTSLREIALTRAGELVLDAPLRRLQQIFDEQATMSEHAPGDIARWRRGEDQYE